MDEIEIHKVIREDVVIQPQIINGEQKRSVVTVVNVGVLLKRKKVKVGPNSVRNKM